MNLNQMENLRQSILKYPFEGKFVTQDLNDESAEILLQRIKQEKLNHETN
jgi:type I restriction enzyme S subunit